MLVGIAAAGVVALAVAAPAMATLPASGVNQSHFGSVALAGPGIDFRQTGPFNTNFPSGSNTGAITGQVGTSPGDTAAIAGTATYTASSGRVQPTFNTLQVNLAAQTGTTPVPAATANNTGPIVFPSQPVDEVVPNGPEPVPAAALRGDHYKCYEVVQSFTTRRTRQLVLRDQFGRVRGVRTAQAVEVCNPVQKIYRNRTTRIRDTRRHLVAYRISTAPNQTNRSISTQNQFGNQLLTTGNLSTVLLPAQKEQLQGKFRRIPRRTSVRVLDHFACYKANGRAARARSVVLADQFENRTNVIPRNRGVKGFCNPTRKTYNGKTTSIRYPLAHLTSYRITGKNSGRRTVRVRTQFGRYRVITRNATRLLVPSAKRICTRFTATDLSIPVNPVGGGAPAATITTVTYTPYDGNPRGACPAT